MSDIKNTSTKPQTITLQPGATISFSAGRTFKECKVKVTNRGVPPDVFLNELVDWALTAPDIIFTPNKNTDIYSFVYPELGPWKSLIHRKAVMLEVLRVLAGFESSWKWTEGVDTHNPTSGQSPSTTETGIFQVSCNAINFDQSLKDLIKLTVGTLDCNKFITEMKANHKLAIEFAARLLRFTTNHNGPVKRKEINPWLSRSAVLEFEKYLQPTS